MILRGIRSPYLPVDISYVAEAYERSRLCLFFAGRRRGSVRFAMAHSRSLPSPSLAAQLMVALIMWLLQAAFLVDMVHNGAPAHRRHGRASYPHAQDRSRLSSGCSDSGLEDLHSSVACTCSNPASSPSTRSYSAINGPFSPTSTLHVHPEDSSRGLGVHTMLRLVLSACQALGILS